MWQLWCGDGFGLISVPTLELPRWQSDCQSGNGVEAAAWPSERACELEVQYDSAMTRAGRLGGYLSLTMLSVV